DVDLVGIGHRRDLEGLREPVPRYVDDSHVYRGALEKRTVVAASEQALAGRDGDGGPAANVGEPLRVARVDLNPGQVIGRHGIGHLQETLGLEVPVEIHEQFNVSASAFAEGSKFG